MLKKTCKIFCLKFIRMAKFKQLFAETAVGREQIK